jgi:hypothetical protein
MVHFAQNAETLKIDKSVESFFKGKSWRVRTTVQNREPMLEISQQDIRLYVKCVDVLLQKSIGASNLVDRFEIFAREFRTLTGEGIIFVISNKIYGLDAKYIYDRGVAVFLIDELPVLEKLNSVFSKKVGDLDGRTRIVVQGCNRLSVQLAMNAMPFDVDEAQRWLELNLNGVYILTEARFKLIELLLAKNDLEAARVEAYKGLSFSQFSLTLLKTLRAIEAKLANFSVLVDLDEKIAVASKRRPSFETLVQAQKEKNYRNQSETYNVNLQTPSGLSSNIIARFFRKLIRNNPN